MRRSVALLLAGSLLVSCGDDDDDCGSCTDGFFLTLGGTGLEAGIWEVEAVVDGEAATCTAQLPQRENREVICTHPGVNLTLGPDDTLGSLFVFGTPEVVAVTVERDGAVIAQQVYEPTYGDVRQEEGCPVACVQAEDSLPIEDLAL